MAIDTYIDSLNQCQFYVMADKLKGNRDKVFWRDLGRYKNKKARKIYILQELIRQYNSSLYERIALSKNKKAVMQLGKKSQIIEGPTDAIKDHTVLEFLDLREDESYTESGLENAIISKLEHFMIELGKGFLFEGRQKRFTVEGDNFYVDLVFYNRLIRSFVLVDIRIGSLTHQDIGQMQMYVNYYDRKIKLPNKNSTIGIILCKEENKTVVEFTLEFMRSSRQLPKQKKLLR